jgi:hypothetical protein
MQKPIVPTFAQPRRRIPDRRGHFGDRAFSVELHEQLLGVVRLGV